MIRFACPTCGETDQVDPTQAGQPGKCTRCEAQFIIPGLPDSPAPPVTQATLPSASDRVEIFPCPKCGTRAQVDRANVGKTVECPGCLSSYEAVATQPISNDLEPQVGKPSRRSKRRRWDDEERDDDYDDDDDDDRPRRRKKRKRPSNITAIAGMLLGGGIYGLMFSLYMLAVTICLWPGAYFGIVWSILAIIRGSAMLNESDRSLAPRVLVILQVVLIVNCDVVNMIMGIVGLVLLNDEQVRAHYERLEEQNS